MRKEVKHYQGYEITMEVLSKLFAINAIRDFKVEGCIPYEDIENIEELSMCINTEVENIHLLLGQDWYITYIVKENTIEILEWVSINKNNDILRQSLEMLRYIVNILLESKNQQVTAVMRHSSSYRFYCLAKQLGYIKELKDNLGIEDTIPYCVISESNHPVPKDDELIEFLKDEQHPKEYEEYIHHDITFSLTKKFYNRYSKDNKKIN